MKIAISLLGGFNRDLFLQELRPVAQGDDLRVKPIEPLAQFGRRQGERNVVAEVELEALHEGAQNHKLPMQAHIGAARPAQHLAALVYVVGKDPFLDAIEPPGHVLRIVVDGVDPILPT